MGTRTKKAKDPARVAIGKRSRRKGGVGQRAFARFLNAWWYDLVDRETIAKYSGSISKLGTLPVPEVPSGETPFKSAPSGDNNRSYMPSDQLVPADFPFAVECKWETRARAFAGLWDTGGAFSRWWKQVVADATTAGKIPMVLANASDLPPSVVVSSRMASRLVRSFPPGSLIVRPDGGWPASVRESLGAHGLLVMPMTGFCDVAYHRAEVVAGFVGW